MANVCDVAAYILKQSGAMTAWKLQKLVYYSQAWSLVWDQRPMFGEPIQAWANGPVCPTLYNKHRGRFMVSEIPGDPSNLDVDAQETIDGVLSFYGDKHPQWLSDLTHSESPWKDARGGLPAGANSSQEITLEAMAAYYESLEPGGELD
ncbi:MAG: type II toxin-antitoxin system antitoxin SocA domain-containing protein [Pseudomonadota bacterium]